MKLACAALLGSAILAAPAAAENAVVRSAVDGFVRPAYAAFHDATVTLEGSVDSLCGGAAEASLESARRDFRETVRAWSRVETIRFGPVTEANRLERILFWPDRKGIGLKQVQAAIAREDPTAADPKSLAGKSVAMQGLGALEFVLFGTGSEDLLGPAGAYRCSYGQAIASNLDMMAGDIETAWSAPDGIASQWANPGPDNPLYRSDDEALTELFNVFVHGLEMLRDVRLDGFLGETATDDRPKSAIFWRSAATTRSLAADLDGLAALFEASGLAGLLDAEEEWIAGSIRFEFANAGRVLDATGDPVAEALADAGRRDKLAYARIVTSSLSELFGVRLSAALGLTAGFSSLDGD